VKRGIGRGAGFLISNISLPFVSDFGFRISSFFLQPELRRVLRLPRVAAVVGGDDLRGDLRAADEERCDIQVQVARGEGGEVFRAELEEADGGAETAAVFGVERVEVLLLQVDEGAGDLDEAFVKERVSIAALEPEMFEDIVRLVVLARIEAGEEAGVVRIERQRGARGELADEGGDAVVFFHRAAGEGKTILRAVVRDKKRLVLEASGMDAP
jgi:hypothetical protein